MYVSAAARAFVSLAVLLIVAPLACVKLGERLVCRLAVGTSFANSVRTKWVPAESEKVCWYVLKPTVNVEAGRKVIDDHIHAGCFRRRPRQMR